MYRTFGTNFGTSPHSQPLWGGHYHIWARPRKWRFLAQNGVQNSRYIAEVIFFVKLGPKYITYQKISPNGLNLAILWPKNRCWPKSHICDFLSSRFLHIWRHEKAYFFYIFQYFYSGFVSTVRATYFALILHFSKLKNFFGIFYEFFSKNNRDFSKKFIKN